MPPPPEHHTIAAVAVAVAGGALFALVGPAAAQPAPDGGEQIVITASGVERRLFETPYAVGVVDAEQLRAAGPMVNLSEALTRIPGLVANNRHNYAQDLQISSRGFGARASFGIRGMRLYSDGIPASGPDGQGQVSHFDLAGAQRVEVLRGPFSALYGSSSGGVISVVGSAPAERRWSVDSDVGSDGLRQLRVGVAAPLDGGFSLRASLARFETDGFRPQSSAERTLGNARLGWDGTHDRIVVVLNAIDQPALDPLGLTPEDFAADPDQTISVALPQSAPGEASRFDTRKSTRQHQAGASWRHRFADAGALRESQVSAFAGWRSVTQWQSIPVSTQLDPVNPAITARQPGGVIDFDRAYRGLDARLLWRWALAGERTASLVAGFSAERSAEDRRGYENFIGSGADQRLGVTGEPRRDERNHVGTDDVYAQGEIELAPAWIATLGLRSGRVRFRSDDRYIRPGNPDDSSRVTYRYTTPVAALHWRVDPTLALYLSVGRGFESPTFNELAYRTQIGPVPLGGFNLDLRPQTSRQVELGAKWRPAAGMQLDAALFDARTDDEIGVETNRGGRTTFQNKGRTLRRGAEASLQWWLDRAWRVHAAATTLDATYVDGFTVCGPPPCLTPTVPVPAGSRIAGTQRALGYAELAWQPTTAGEFALEGRAQGSVAANDANTVFAPGHGLLALRARWRVEFGAGRLDLLGRLDNLADRRVVGSVIVNEGNRRFFEPAPGRSWLVSARWSSAF